MAKPKKCRECGREFTPSYSNLQTCCNLTCSLEYAKKKQDKKQSKAWNIEKRERLDKLKTLTDWKKGLEQIINEIIRLIDKDQPCMMCSITIKKTFACHYHSVGSNDTLRFNLFNIWAGCFSCNGAKGGNLHCYDMLLIEKLGHERWEYIKFDLTRIYSHLGLTIQDIKEVLPEAKQIRSELKSSNLIYTYEQRWKLREKYNTRLGIYKTDQND